MNRLLQLGVNTRGHDFVIGDIHGKHTELMVGLETVNFDFENDRLIAVGDLIDRGKQNMECLRLIGEPWFYTVVGNHEMLMVDALEEGAIMSTYTGKSHQQHWLYRCGGYWYTTLDDDEMGEIQDTFVPYIRDEMPVAIEFIAENGQRVGVTHGGLPKAWTWDQTRKAVECVNKMTDAVVINLMWTRTRIQSTEPPKDILGVDLLVNGHTPSKKEVWRGNNVFIDLGVHNQLIPINVLDLFDRMESNV